MRIEVFHRSAFPPDSRTQPAGAARFKPVAYQCAVEIHRARQQKGVQRFAFAEFELQHLFAVDRADGRIDVAETALFRRDRCRAVGLGAQLPGQEFAGCRHEFRRIEFHKPDRIENRLGAGNRRLLALGQGKPELQAGRIGRGQDIPGGNVAAA
ncbi:hypothetical protein SDC9_118632 [bioreactor metagenome]|uniref:Uncharacterized protein n=1 Tax=bioreactor metagenome TaxID=1076179 RepID=A0A645C212_9ZZZZ